MPHDNVYDILVLPGDGIGHEITPPTIELLTQIQATLGGFELRFTERAAGARHYQETGESLPEEAMNKARQADAILLACMGLPEIRYEDGREIAPQLELRETLDLFAGVRPVKTMPGLPLPLADPRGRNLDFVLIRESTEGLFASRDKFQLSGEGDGEFATDTQVISRRGSDRLFRFACDLASRRLAAGYSGRLTCVDKANVLGSFYYMRQRFDAIAADYPNLTADHIYIDAAALQLVRQPWQFDVMVTENMFGDILSDLGAGLMGGMGMAPSADIGIDHAVFQPCHGSAPDIIGLGKANPTAMFLSAAMMLDWLGQRHNNEHLCRASTLIDQAVEMAYSNGDLIPYELGGESGTEAIKNSVFAALKKLNPTH